MSWCYDSVDMVM